MRKFLILAVMVLGVTTVLMAQSSDSNQPPATNQNWSCCDMHMSSCCGSSPCGKWHGGGKHMNEAPAITLKDAKSKVEAYVKSNFKGYKVLDVKEDKGRSGRAIFTADVVDASGNKFIFHVSPWGDVRGPMSSDMYNQMRR